MLLGSSKKIISHWNWVRHLVATQTRGSWVPFPSSATEAVERALPFNPLNTKRKLLYLKTQFLPRSKHFSSRL